MKKIVSIILCSLYLSCYCQTSWTLSNTGFPSNYNANETTTSPNGDIYLVSSLNNNGHYIPKLFKSVDNGDHWTEIMTVGLPDTLNPYTIIYTGNKLLIAGSGANKFYIYASLNNGLNWSPSNTGLNPSYSPNDFTQAPNGDIFLAASQNTNSTFIPKVLKSINNGSSWTEITTSGLTNTLIPNTICYVNNKLLLSGTAPGAYYVYASIDNGLTWYSSNTGIPPAYGLVDITVVSGQEIYGVCAKLSGGIFNSKVIKSTDAGINWTEISPLVGLNNLLVAYSILYSNNNLILTGSDNITPLNYIFKSSIGSVLSLTDRQFEKNKSLSFYPNPTNGLLKIFSDLGESATILDVLGNTICILKLNPNENSIDLSNLSNGIYFLKTESGEKIKVVKQ